MSSSFKTIYAGEQSLAPNMGKAKQYTSFSLKQSISQLVDIANSGCIKIPFTQNYVSKPLLEKNEILESIAAHTELTTALFERALIEAYGEDFGEPGAKNQRTEDGYSYREAMEAARIYNLYKVQKDDKKLFYGRYVGGYGRGAAFGQQVIKLTVSIGETPTTATEKMLLLADRTATIFLALTKDRRNEPGTISRGHPWLSDEEKDALKKLPLYVKSDVQVSQYLLYKFFKIDKLTLLDDTGYFTAIIIAYTLNIVGYWPSWREDDYN